MFLTKEREMAVKQVLLLGDPRLYEVSNSVSSGELGALSPIISDLHDTLLDFRGRSGAGRAIAAPQIGVMKRLIYLHVDQPLVMVNPRLEKKSSEMFEVWDDCLCFPELLVKVLRHQSCTVCYQDLFGKDQRLAAQGSLAELLQHEYDHLDGILAVSRAVDGRSFALRGSCRE
jgi:peptide deformylase